MISALLFSSLLGAGPPTGSDVRGVIQTVRQAFIEDGTDRVARTATHRVVSHDDGSLELQGLQPLRIALQSVGREGAAPCLAGLISREAQTNTIISQRACGIEERWTNEGEGLAHAFVVKHAPEGTGGLTLRLSVEGPWHHEDARGHVFKGPGAAALLRYGNAFVVREGQRLPITVMHVDGGLELRIPRAMVDAKNAFPMIIDPLVSAEVPLDLNWVRESPPTSEEAPAIAVNRQGMAMVVWVDGRRQVSTDIFGARLSDAGVLLDPAGLPLAVGPGDQLRPTICATGNSFFVAWDAPLLDGSLQVSGLRVSAAGISGTKLSIGPGSQPSVTSVADAGVFLAMVDPGSFMQVVSVDGTTVRTVPRPITSSDTDARPVITSYESRWFVAWESTRLGAPANSIKGMFSGAREFVVHGDSEPARRLSVAMGPGPTGVETHVFWEQDAGVHGVRIDGNLPLFQYEFPGSSRPAVVSNSSGLAAAALLGVMSANSVRLIDLNDGGESGFQVGATATDLVLAQGGGLFAAWTESPIAGGDVLGALIGPSPASTQPVAVSWAVTAQRGAKVAMHEQLNEGLAVWVDDLERVRGANLGIGANGLVVSTSFPVVNVAAPIEQLEVTASVAGPTYLVAWRTRAGALGAQLMNPTGVIGLPVMFSPSGVIAGPAVAWDAAAGTYVVAWGQERANAFAVMSIRLSLRGVTSNERPHGSEQAKAIALTCLGGRCLLAYERAIQRDVKALLMSSLSGPVLLKSSASQPVVAHDGQDFFVGWRSNNTFRFARIDAMGVSTDLPPAPLVSNGRVGRLSMASAQPPVASWNELTAGEVTAVYLHRLGFQGPAQFVASGFSPSISTAGVLPEARGVVVYERLVERSATDQLQTTRAFGVMFTDFAVTPDAGTPDAGEIDGGSAPDAGSGEADAGVMDAGTPADGGPMFFETMGCTCQSFSSAPLVVLGLLALRRRRAVQSNA